MQAALDFLRGTRGDSTQWQDQAICVGDDQGVYFTRRTVHAKKVCMNCPVRPACLEDALERDIRFGVYGGLTWSERKALKKQQRAA